MQAEWYTLHEKLVQFQIGEGPWRPRFLLIDLEDNAMRRKTMAGVTQCKDDGVL